MKMANRKFTEKPITVNDSFQPEIVTKPKDAHCVIPGCTEPIAKGQTYVCVKHQKTN